MNTRMLARDLAEEAPLSLGKRVARIAMAINGSSVPYVSKSYWKQAKTGIAGRSYDEYEILPIASSVRR